MYTEQTELKTSYITMAFKLRMVRVSGNSDKTWVYSLSIGAWTYYKFSLQQLFKKTDNMDLVICFYFFVDHGGLLVTFVLREMLFETVTKTLCLSNNMSNKMI